MLKNLKIYKFLVQNFNRKIKYAKLISKSNETLNTEIPKEYEEVIEENKNNLNEKLSSQDFLRKKIKFQPKIIDKNYNPKDLYYSHVYLNENLPTLDDYYKILKDAKAYDISVMALKDKCSFADYMIFVTGITFRQMKSMAKRISEEVKIKLKIDWIEKLKIAQAFYRRKGRRQLDGNRRRYIFYSIKGTIIIQIFSPEGRDKYDLERK
jgi:ribosomal silencing factor RsfS